jgi:predicted nucleic acid-binding protein
MNLVVSDASPLRYLVAIDAVHILPELFSKLIIPEHVIATELQGRRTPSKVCQVYRSSAHFALAQGAGSGRIVEMAPAEESEREMFVMLNWEDRKLAVPLAQLEPNRTDKAT